MANVGHYIDRNPEMRAAGVSTYLKPSDMYGAKELFVNVDTMEEAEHQILAHCRRLRPKSYGIRNLKYPVENTDVFRNSYYLKEPFADSKDKFRENSFIRRPVLGQAMETFSKPDYVTNSSRTFGCASHAEDNLYSVIMPPKTVEQVNREYRDFHDNHIISHNHYFPSEQINRRYSQHFNRFNTFGTPTNADPCGNKVKRCLDEGEEHLKIVKKPKKDLDDRTKAPLGKKYIWYPYKIPENMTFGRIQPRDLDMRHLLENTSPCIWTEKLRSAISHLNQLRHLLGHLDDFHISQVINALAKKDTAETGLLPLTQIIQTMNKMNIPADLARIRTAASHFQFLVDEGSCEERVKYVELCNLLSLLRPLPMVGTLAPEPAAIYNKSTTYRELCADLAKTPEEGRRVYKRPHRKEDVDNTHVEDVIKQDGANLSGIWPSDFRQLRAKDEMKRIFEGIVSTDAFESIWQGLIDKLKDPQDMASIEQFRAEMIRFEDEKKSKAKEIRTRNE